RTEGDANGINDKGLVTYDRSIKKDAFYFYKANWSAKPVLYIAERRNSQRTIATTKIKVYTNAKTVELWLNGVKQSKGTKNSINIAEWNNIQLMQGKNIIVVKAKVGNKTIEDSCEWILQAGNIEK